MIADRIENLVFALPEPIAAEIQKHLSGITDETFQTGNVKSAVP
jgi:hypothetical protein